MYLFSGVLEERCHSQFIAIYADIKEVKTIEGFGQTGGRIKPS
jgi:hypothetical protein